MYLCAPLDTITVPEVVYLVQMVVSNVISVKASLCVAIAIVLSSYWVVHAFLLVQLLITWFLLVARHVLLCVVLVLVMLLIVLNVRM